MKKLILNTLLLATLSLSFPYSVFAGKIYKWVDEEGVTQFTNTPPPPGKNVEAEKIKISSNEKSKAVVADNMMGVWFVVENGKKIQLIFTQSGFRVLDASKFRSSESISSGAWEVNGTKLTLNYKHHKEKNKIGATDHYYVLKVTDIHLELLRESDEKKIVYRKNTNLLRKDKLISRLAKKIMGTWNGLNREETISFSKEQVTVSGNVEEYSKAHKDYIKRWSQKYEGMWRVEDPYIIIDVTNDYISTGNRSSRAGKEMRYFIIKLEDNQLTVRDETTRKKKRFIKAE